jgi:hypothetical protein
VSRDVTGSAEFLGEAAALASRLRERGRSMFDVRYDGLAFGSWVVTAGTPQRRVVVTWDGRDGRLSAEAAGFADSQSRPSWRNVSEQQPADRSPAALLRLAEQIILAESGAPAA